MDPVDAIAERRIREALERGELDDLPGAGRPLELDDDAHVPSELRAAYRLLKNAGFLPPEVELRREIGEAQALIDVSTEPEERNRAQRRLELLRQRLCGDAHRDLRLDEQYYQEVCARLDTQQGGDQT
ncbi:hypothetical protein BJI67_09435 [Acidihalobacter aeolianus]|uniref:DnaJ homologue subfamily C member 28 conserved domain-containing protein n=1 Tax=Acidihalobacter aeolianus TaxID=2792603 RepID=A0A1D8K8G6_9GAMM|nr:DnaJ family domain-containing protein [Acidihalobacter aeolianus]AOV17257.1 hypothetical protein BJI67_09435 [Acidihalobacter aeolianus]